jgi:riboflavin kinase/FMN adenylyltransferase
VEVVILAAPPGPTGSAQSPPTAHRSRAGPYSSVAIGSFDGVHLGHRQVLAGCDTVLTFDPHPMHVLAARRAPCLLSDHPTKLRKLAAVGIRRVAIIRFDETWSHLAASEFVERVLLGRLGARIISVGANFRFGAGGTATPATFAGYPSLQTRVIPLVTGGPDGMPISSTRIRQLVAGGDVEAAAVLLGSPLVLPALVIDHDQLAVDDRFAVPAPGVYHGSVDGRPTVIRVAGRGITTGTAAAQPGATVAVAFLQRRD